MFGKQNNFILYDLHESFEQFMFCIIYLFLNLILYKFLQREESRRGAKTYLVGRYNDSSSPAGNNYFQTIYNRNFFVSLSHSSFPALSILTFHLVFSPALSPAHLLAHVGPVATAVIINFICCLSALRVFGDNYSNGVVLNSKEGEKFN